MVINFRVALRALHILIIGVPQYATIFVKTMIASGQYVPGYCNGARKRYMVLKMQPLIRLWITTL